MNGLLHILGCVFAALSVSLRPKEGLGVGESGVNVATRACAFPGAEGADPAARLPEIDGLYILGS